MTKKIMNYLHLSCYILAAVVLKCFMYCILEKKVLLRVRQTSQELLQHFQEITC